MGRKLWCMFHKVCLGNTLQLPGQFMLPYARVHRVYRSHRIISSNKHSSHKANWFNGQMNVLEWWCCLIVRAFSPQQPGLCCSYLICKHCCILSWQVLEACTVYNDNSTVQTWWCWSIKFCFCWMYESKSYLLKCLVSILLLSFYFLAVSWAVS